MRVFFQTKLGRLTLHLLAYGAAAGLIAILGEVRNLDFGTYSTIVTLGLGAVIDGIRKYMTTI